MSGTWTRRRRLAATRPAARPPPPAPVPAPSPTSPHQLARSLDKVMEEAEVSGVLTLAARKLKSFPSAVATKFDLSDVVSIDISENRLNELPMPVCELDSLETLQARGNQLRRIPGAVSLLHHLTYIDVSCNQLRELPPALFELPLEICLLAGNHLESLPRVTGQVASTLAELDLSYNRLSSLSTDLSLLSALRILNVSHNKIEIFPAELCSLFLQVLDVSSNCIQRLPVQFTQLRTITSLTLWPNPLVAPPLRVVERGREHVFKWLSSHAPEGWRHSAGPALRTVNSNSVLSSSSWRQAHNSTSALRKATHSLTRGLSVAGVESGYASTVTVDERLAEAADEGFGSSTSSAASKISPSACSTASCPSSEPLTCLLKVYDEKMAEAKAETVEEKRSDPLHPIPPATVKKAEKVVTRPTAPPPSAPPSTRTPPSAEENKGTKTRPVSKVAPMQAGLVKTRPVSNGVEKVKGLKAEASPSPRPVPPPSTKAPPCPPSTSNGTGTKRSPPSAPEKKGGVEPRRPSAPSSASSALVPAAARRATTGTTTVAPSAKSSLLSRRVPPLPTSSSSSTPSSSSKPSTVTAPLRVAPARTGGPPPTRPAPSTRPATTAVNRVQKATPSVLNNNHLPGSGLGSPSSSRSSSTMTSGSVNNNRERRGSSDVDALKSLLVARAGWRAELPLSSLSDGVALCSLANALHPGVCTSIARPTTGATIPPSKCRQNAESFLEACRSLKVSVSLSPEDIVNRRNVPLLAKAALALSRSAAALPVSHV